MYVCVEIKLNKNKEVVEIKQPKKINIRSLLPINWPKTDSERTVKYNECHAYVVLLVQTYMKTANTWIHIGPLNRNTITPHPYHSVLQKGGTLTEILIPSLLHLTDGFVNHEKPPKEHLDRIIVSHGNFPIMRTKNNVNCQTMRALTISNAGDAGIMAISNEDVPTELYSRLVYPIMVWVTTNTNKFIVKLYIILA